jgi:hypothetical protein
MKDWAKPDQTQFGTRMWCISEFDKLLTVYFFTGFSLISPGFGPSSGYWCRVVRNLLKTLIIKDNPLLTITTSS